MNIIQQLCWQGKISVRLGNVLLRNNYKTLKKAKSDIIKGTLHPTKGTPRLHNYGVTLHSELCKLVGIKEKSKQLICPCCKEKLKMVHEEWKLAKAADCTQS
jgi:hypothetical protein